MKITTLNIVVYFLPACFKTEVSFVCATQLESYFTKYYVSFSLNNFIIFHITVYTLHKHSI